ncbi:hypothetical protein N7492_004348 [Penicillium capsulatum]|uniref:Transcription factor CBF/NF-Y/archaeal histone domain-containing protein n=1 Tax=Penicillium capsulatum TaxID=69766 RepID=A0A9W9IAA8_9EURO|nr:hypothetical protein N7492_004348 [Penicillium capsulatum]
MAATQKLYPRGTVKRVVKAHSNRSVSKNADILIFLDYMLFMQEYDLTPPPPTQVSFPCAPSQFLGCPSARNCERVANRPSRLMREASIRSRKSGEKNISANSIRKVTEVRVNLVWLAVLLPKETPSDTDCALV